VLARLAAVAACAIGVSGALAWLAGRWVGRAFVAGDPAGVTYTAARCRELHEYAPKARICEQAAVSHHFGEIVSGRLAVGAAGLVLLCFLPLLGRRWKPFRSRLPAAFEATVATSLTAVSATLLFLDGLGRLITGSDHGAGGPLSGAAVSTVLAVSFGRSLHRQIAAQDRRPNDSD